MVAISVAVGIVANKKGELLLAKRPGSTDYAGYWEFPGGKVEKDETIEQALVREFKEEIGIEVTEYQWLVKVLHTYSDKQVELNVWYVKRFAGEPRGLEGQDLQWVLPDNLKDFSLLPANDKIIDVFMAKRFSENR